MSEILNSIWEDGVQVLGVIAWSFVDNWEFGDFSPHYGMQTVDRTTQERRYKKSLFDFVDFIQARTGQNTLKRSIIVKILGSHRELTIGQSS